MELRVLLKETLSLSKGTSLLRSESSKFMVLRVLDLPMGETASFSDVVRLIR